MTDELFNVNAILVKEHCIYVIIVGWGDKGFHAFPKSISMKLNVIIRLELELSYF